MYILHIFVFKKNNIVGSKYIFGIVSNNINNNDSPTIKLIIQQPASQNGAGWKHFSKNFLKILYYSF